MMPIAADRPDGASAMGSVGYTGAPSGASFPLRATLPPYAWAIMSEAGRSASGPVDPNPVISA